VGLAAYLVYPLGFLIVILGRAQLFTENTVTPVIVALTDPRSIPNMLRLWVVVFIANILGATAFSAVIVYGHILEPGALQILFEEVSHKAEYGFGSTFFKAIFGGWLVALIAWLVAASQDINQRTISLRGPVAAHRSFSFWISLGVKFWHDRGAPESLPERLSFGRSHGK
jgi:formate/nitrite transporter FocA (FNT family)